MVEKTEVKLAADQVDGAETRQISVDTKQLKKADDYILNINMEENTWQL